MKSKAFLLAAACLAAFSATPTLAASAGETYQQQQSEYRQQVKDYWAARAKYDREVVRYDWSRYHRYPRDWPANYSRYSDDGIYQVAASNLIDSRIDARDGTRIGTVYDIDVDAAGRLRGVQVDLSGSRSVWIDAADLRYDPATKTLYTFLTTSQVRDMSVVG